MNKKLFTLIVSILIYVLVKFQEFIFFTKRIRENVSIISEQPSYIVFRCMYYLQFKALSNLQCLLTKHYIFPFVISCLPNVGNILHTCSITTGFFFSFVSQSSFFKTYLVLHRTINKMKFKNVVDKLCLQTVLRPQ